MSSNRVQDCQRSAPHVSRRRRGSILALTISLCLSAASLVNGQSLVGGRNVNIAGGKQTLSISPFEVRGDVLNRAQNEPSCAFSTRNPKNVLCGTNDYRMMDVPGVTHYASHPRCLVGRVPVGRRRRHLGKHAASRLLSGPDAAPAAPAAAPRGGRPDGPLRTGGADVLQRHRIHPRSRAQHRLRHDLHRRRARARTTRCRSSSCARRFPTSARPGGSSTSRGCSSRPRPPARPAPSTRKSSRTG